MSRINVARVINSSKWHTTFTVYRKTGDWVNSRFVQNDSSIDFDGASVPATTKDIMQVPEGDRTLEIRIFLTKKELYVTRNGEIKGTSDEVLWNGKRFKIVKVKDWREFGYYRSIGVCLEGD